ncbi:MAG: RNA-binding S4 domain-containing protein [Schleiferiaceae bacterium]|jgi:ribosome-associated protein|nr:RNA-binding S4 domain-containing protein [Schleiferiaceae bacterium]
MEFELNGKEFIELNKLLKILSLVESGGQANLFITDGQVTVNGEVETAKRKKLREGDVVSFMDQEILIK